ncbi:MAG: hypothetical protein O2856_01610 [Planctomycetota bacterium]|nr:hypothetical protein [Planctomycetota bacterium]
MNIFARSLTDNLAGLVREVDAKIDENKDQKLVGFVVLLTDDPDKAETDLKAFADKHGIKNVPMTYFDGVAGPEKYKIAKEADVTVNLWVEQSSKANYAFAKDELNDKTIAKVIADVPKILE